MPIGLYGKAINGSAPGKNSVRLRQEPKPNNGRASTTTLFYKPLMFPASAPIGSHSGGMKGL